MRPGALDPTPPAGSRRSTAEGYVVASYGEEQYLHHALASARTIRRHDARRPIALYCSEGHRELLERHELTDAFDLVAPLPEAHQSIVGFKHHLHRFMPFERTLFADADMVWCRDPEPLWQQLRAYGFTATGLERADAGFGAAKGVGMAANVLLRRRERTLRRFGLERLPRVQSGLMFAQDRALTQAVCEAAQGFLARQEQTHFRSRLREHGRDLESCEWSLAMAMSALGVPVLPWRQGPDSPQVDFFEAATAYDSEFREVTYRYFPDRFVHELQSVHNAPLRRLLLAAASSLPGQRAPLYITPFALHFGWLREKRPFLAFAERTWALATKPSRPESMGATSPS